MIYNKIINDKNEIKKKLFNKKKIKLQFCTIEIPLFLQLWAHMIFFCFEDHAWKFLKIFDILN